MERPFLGRFDHSLDAKGRLTLPARFRGVFSTEIFATPHVDRCLALWTEAAFMEQQDAMLKVQGGGRDQRNMARLWAANSQVLEVDSQGRVLLPGVLQEYANLAKDVVVAGAIDHVELWNPASWAEGVLTSEERLVDRPGVVSVDGEAGS